MDGLQNVHRRSSKDASLREKKKKKKQVKVVYISNPMHFKASASEFKGLVQQFTGQDSDVAELCKFTGAEDHFSDDHPVASVDRPSTSTDDDSTTASHFWPVSSAALQQQQLEAAYTCGMFPPLDAFDDVFTPQVLENLTPFMPTSLCYESTSPIV